MMENLDKIVRATAGAGKTTGLLEAVYDTYKFFLKKEEKWPKILLSTFTVKAANELSERLIARAVDLKDEEFLDYVVSNFLEVGTLHSVFLKILDQLNGEEGDVLEQRYFSQTNRYKVGRGMLHKVIREEGAEKFFAEARDEKDALNAFFHMYENSGSAPVIVDFKNLSLAVLKKINHLALSTDDDEFMRIVKDSKEFSDILSYIGGLEVKKQKKFKDVKKFIEDEANSLIFLKRYSERQSAYSSLYIKWKLQLATYITDNQIDSISDAEVQVLNKLESKGFKQKIWDFCFFDEYQDTSPMQKKIIDIVSAKSINYFVGDPFQSIYFFRGARKEIFLQEFKNIERLRGKTEYRLNNYRSASEIVNFANGLTKFILPDFIEMEPFVREVKGSVQVVHFSEGSAVDEFTYVKDELQKIDLNKESVAVLSRGSKELLMCGKELRKAGVAHKFSLSKGFESSLEVIELVSFLSFLSDPHNDENLLILLMSYWCEVSDQDLKLKFEEVNNGEVESLWQAFNEHKGVQTLERAVGSVGKLPLYLILSDFVGESGFLDFTEALDTTKGREQNILKLISALEAEEAKRNFVLQGFCDDISSGVYRFESEEVKSDSGCLLMTIHGSKGLQFDHVFIIGMNKVNSSKTKSYYFNLEENLFSSKEYSLSEAKMRFPLFVEDLVVQEKAELTSENRRLFYVAMTRAKKSLQLVGSNKIPKVSKSPSWLSLTVDFLKKTNQEDLYSELESIEALPGAVEEQKLCGGFLLRMDKSEFLEKQTLAVTGEEAKDQEYEDRVDKFSKLSSAISEGVLFHEMMERVDSLSAAMNEVSQCFSVEHDKHRDAVKYLFEQVKFPFDKILQSGEKEWGFDFNGEKRISGKIDLWAAIDDTVWLVDYKTGEVSGAEKGFDQLKVYKNMLEIYLGKEKKFKYNLVLTFPYNKKTFIEASI